MQELQEYTAAGDEIRSLRVDGLMPMMDAFYLFNCFYDNAEVLAATVLRNVQTGINYKDYGFVEFASHSIADFVLKSYNGEMMPNYNNERYCLSWDTDGFGTRWRWDRYYRCCTFFGFDKDAVELDGLAVIQLYKDSIPFFTKIRVPDNVAAYPNKRLNKSKQEKYLELEAVCPPNKRLKSSKEKELYLCFNEICSRIRKSCYVVRTIKLSELFACSCEFSIESKTLTKCKYCSAIDQPEHQLRQRAWFPWETDRHSTTVTNLPMDMGCCASGSRLYLAGGMVPPPDPETVGGNVPRQPSGDVYSFDAESTSWYKLDWSFKKEKPDPLLFEVKGNLYCLACQPMTGVVEHPTFEVYDSLSGKCEVLPDPPFYKLEREGGCLLRCHPGLELSYAIVGTKILISSKLGKQSSPVMCFDVNDKQGESKWREMTSLFDGKGFPFDGRALVLDVNDGTHVMFSFRCDYQMIFVNLLHSLDDGSISISREKCLGRPFSEIRSLMHAFGNESYAFVDLGDQKVGFVFCGNRQRPVDLKDHDSDPWREARVLVVVIQYKLLDSDFLISKILATRTFDYKCHSPSPIFANLVGGIVV